jgi:hypothetical protein
MDGTVNGKSSAGDETLDVGSILRSIEEAIPAVDAMRQREGFPSSTSQGT